MHGVGVDAMTTVEAVDIKTSHSAGTKEPKVGKKQQQNKTTKQEQKELKWERKKNIPFEDDPVRDYF